MAKIMEIVAKETKGKSYHTYKYSYDSVGLPSIDYDDDPNKIMKWKDSAETGSPKRSIDIVNIGLHFFLKNVRPYAASCNES